MVSTGTQVSLHAHMVSTGTDGSLSYGVNWKSSFTFIWCELKLTFHFHMVSLCQLELTFHSHYFMVSTGIHGPVSYGVKTGTHISLSYGIFRNILFLYSIICE